MSTGRYAIYFAPPRHSPWHAFGSGWLGRDEFDGMPVPPRELPGFDFAQVSRLTAEPRRYGFHATLKAPFRLGQGSGEQELLARVAAIARRWQAMPLGALVPVHLDGFVALVPSQPHAVVDALAAQCVTALDALRAPLDAAERARRTPQQLDARGRELLDLYGYPHVLERFRFHMSLTGPVDADTADRLLAQLAPALSRLNADAPLWLDRLCVFHEPVAGAPFVRLHDVELGP
ncbi:DUF1045 domain-containing protein [Ramlibacter sp.]|uniref:DUF1045 domain-containing protein n=1 Tax=Ramlibacter sp. TaxID=1917967 RepID=UPI00181C0EAB|nr:DUF1045 domain-containing protein [Ramlibacter sp.]MBA2673908.1 DUF1045 domain-containing protein [Ramlibacter sp.]